jgi:16S rRNA (guanine527-N7)-methyltransferase
MKINNFEKEEFSEKVIRIAKDYNIQITYNIAEKLEKYKKLLLEWNEKINLTAIVDEEEIIVKHFIDCLECIKHIKRGDKIVDVGTGAGFPGIVLAIYFEGQIEITLVDALNKRVLFLKEVVEKLEIENVTVINSRSEDLSRETRFREKFDIVTARAVSSLNVLLECTIALIKKEGKCIFMKGDNVSEEIKIAKKALTVLKCDVETVDNYILKIKNEEFNRNILKINKTDITPSEYPRNYGNIKKKPLL